MSSCGGAALPFSLAFALAISCAAGCTTGASWQPPPSDVPAAQPAHSCPQGMRYDGARCAVWPPGSAPGPVAQPDAPPEKALSPTDALARRQRDLRPKLSPRSRPLLVVESAQLERLFDATPTSSPDRPMILWRLAEDESEEALSAGLSQEHAATAHLAHEAAAKHFARIGREYPAWCRHTAAGDPSKNQGCADEAWYFSGYESELGGSLSDARLAYVRIIKDFPASVYTPYAYVAFGEAFLTELDSDPSYLRLASECYEKASAFTDSKIRPLALLRSAEVFEKMDDTPHALQAYQTLIKSYPDSPEAALVPSSKRATDL